MKKELLLFFIIFNTYFTVQAFEKLYSMCFAKHTQDMAEYQKQHPSIKILNSHKGLFKEAIIGAACLLTANSCYACYATTTCLKCVGCTCALCTSQIGSACALQPALDLVNKEPNFQVAIDTNGWGKYKTNKEPDISDLFFRFKEKKVT